jgi:hypothetical protein
MESRESPGVQVESSETLAAGDDRHRDRDRSGCCIATRRSRLPRRR